MVQIKFIALGANSAIGAFQPGDTLRCSEAMARHLVKESGVAQYVETTAASAPQATRSPLSTTESRPAAKTKPRRARAEAEVAGAGSQPEAGERADAVPAVDAQPVGSADAESSAEGVVSTTQIPGAAAEA